MSIFSGWDFNKPMRLSRINKEHQQTMNIKSRSTLSRNGYA
ncbi:MAG: hypothetical protein PHC47_02830 [Clostridia bacterium]|nr:hypothetical protein [Clostridia bacterium]